VWKLEAATTIPGFNSSYKCSHRTRHRSVVDDGASTPPDCVEPFPNDISKPSSANSNSIRVSHFIDLRSIGNVRSLEHSDSLGAYLHGSQRSLEHSATPGAEAAGGLASDQRVRVFTDFGHNVVLEKETMPMLFIPPLIACTRNKVMIRPNIPRAPGNPRRAPLMMFNLSLGSPTPDIQSSAERATTSRMHCSRYLT
jgi:hypothetical protein